jgi:endonuclease YncB( thermonuclease family)
MTKISEGLGSVFLLLFLLMAGCGVSPPAAQPRPVFELPTAQTKPEASPVSTRVMPLDSLTPAPTATITPIPDETLGLVVEVIDGETIAVVMDGDPMKLAYVVRYLGIDAPPNSPEDPWGVVAYETNRALTNLKVVRLVRDTTDFDEDGNLLRYVYAGNELINSRLVAEGLARAAIDSDNTRLETTIRAAETEAREADLGIWGSAPPTPTPASGPLAATRVLTATPQITATNIVTVSLTATVTETAGASGVESSSATPTSTPTGFSTQTATPTATVTLTTTGQADSDLRGPSN